MTRPERGAQTSSAALARFVGEARWDDLPQAIRHEAKRALLNFFACSLGGSRDAAIEAASWALRPYAKDPTATVIGRGERRDTLDAAFLNAASANVYDFDDTHTRTVIHPTAPVAAALVALAEAKRMSGAALLHALVLGIEVECRIGNAVSPDHYRRGWHITSTCGVFGAAAAVGRALGLTAERLLWTLGIASAQAGGLLETLGSMAKSVSVGNAARNGLTSALFAQAGVAGPARPLEGAYGFLQVTASAPDVTRLTEGLGAHWEIALNTYKPYPCGIVLSPVIDACFELRRDTRIEPGEVERIEITGHPLLRERTDRVHPGSGREAQVSAQHSVAVVLTHARAGLAEFSDACAADGSLRALREKVAFVDDTAYAVESANVAIRLRDGRTVAHTVVAARGSLERPLSDRDLERKLEALIGYSGSRSDPARLAEAIWSLDAAPDAGAVAALAAA